MSQDDRAGRQASSKTKDDTLARWLGVLDRALDPSPAGEDECAPEEILDHAAGAPSRAGRAPGLAELVRGPQRTFEGVLAVAVPPGAAAAVEAPASPVPDERRALVEEPGVFRLAYQRHGTHAALALFADQPDAVTLSNCRLDGRELAVATERGGEVIRLELGAVQQLIGRRLSLVLALHGVDHELCWTLESS